jgi:hypothetical protein
LEVLNKIHLISMSKKWYPNQAIALFSKEVMKDSEGVDKVADFLN